MTESPFSIQIRDDNAWLTIRGNDYADFVTNLAIAIGEERSDAFLARFQAEKNLRDGGMLPPATPPTATSAPPAPPAYTPPAAPPPPPAAPPAPPARPAALGVDWKANAPDCQHGRMRPYEGTYKSGRNAGETYYAFFCSASKDTPKNQKCSPVDAITGKSWN